MTFLKNLYFKAYVISKLVKKEAGLDVSISWNKKLYMWSKGFFSSSYILYDLERNNYKDYLSDYQENLKAVRINGSQAPLLDNKISFYRLIKDQLKIPDDIGLIEHNKIIPLNDFADVTKIEDLLKLKEPFILKPIDSASGTGVVKVNIDNAHITYNDELISENDFMERVSKLDNYIVSNFIKSAKYSLNIYPKAVNTVRLLTMISPNNGKAFIAASAHRFATDKSFPVDNCNAGGLTASIDLESGKLGKVVAPYFKGNRLEWHSNHPDTGEKIEGIVIPHWQIIKSAILSTAQKLNNIKYIGWDVAVTDEGFLVIEGNDGPDIKLHQVHGPLLAIPDVKNFYKYYNVI